MYETNEAGHCSAVPLLSIACYLAQQAKSYRDEVLIFRQALSMDKSRLITELRTTIGRVVHYRGVRCCVIELLEDYPALVFRVEGPPSSIQDNQFGDPHRRVTETFTLPCLDAEGKELHPELTALGLLGG